MSHEIASIANAPLRRSNVNVSLEFRFEANLEPLSLQFFALAIKGIAPKSNVNLSKSCVKVHCSGTPLYKKVLSKTEKSPLYNGQPKSRPFNGF